MNSAYITLFLFLFLAAELGIFLYSFTPPWIKLNNQIKWNNLNCTNRFNTGLIG